MSYLNPYKKNTITVAKQGGQYTSIGAALAVASSGDCILVSPGTYTEDPFTIPANVTLKGNKTTLVANDPNSVFVTFSAYSALHDMGIDGVSNESACKISGAGPTGIAFIENCYFSNCLVAVHANGLGNQFILEETKMYNTVATAVLADGSGRVDCSNILGYATTMCDANNGTIWVHNSGCLASTNAIYARAGGKIFLHNFTGESCTNFIVVDGATTVVEGIAVYSRSTVTYDILQTNSALVNISSAFMDQEKFSLNAPQYIQVFFGNETSNDESFICSKQLVVGIAEYGRNARFGSGDTTTRGMLVYTYNQATATYTDVTAAAKSPSGSTFTFPGTAVDNAIYVTTTLSDGDFKQIKGMRVLIDTAAVLGATGVIVSEYWNGAAWATFNTMSVDKTLGRYPHSKKEIFLRTGEENINFSYKMEADWTKNDPPTLGTNRFWFRFRISSAVTTAPVFQQFVTYFDQSKLNGDGFLEYKGRARPLKRLPWDWGLVEAAADSPADQDIYVSDNLDVGRVENSFANGAIDRSGFNAYLPFDLDTSCPIRLRWSWFESVASTDAITWVLRWGYTNSDLTSAESNVYPSTAAAPATGPNEQSLTINTPAINQTNKQRTYEAELDVSDLVSRRSGATNFGDILWFSLQRSGSTDPYSGSCYVIALSAYYSAWCEGGHLP